MGDGRSQRRSLCAVGLNHIHTAQHDGDAPPKRIDRRRATLYLNKFGSTVRVGKVGSGTPTASGQTITNLPGFPATTGSPYAFFFADLDGAPGIDTLYVADESIGITKYSLVSGNWTSNGTVATDSYRGLTGMASAAAVSLFATRKGGSGATGGWELVSIVDSSGYNGAFTGTPTFAPLPQPTQPSAALRWRPKPADPRDRVSRHSPRIRRSAPARRPHSKSWLQALLH